MNLIRYYQPSVNTFRGLDSFLDRSFPLFSKQLGLGSCKNTQASFDLFETPEGHALRLELPGVSKEAIDVTLEDSILTVRVSSETETEGEAKEDRQVTRYERSLKVPQGVDSEKITATSENGLLTVLLPKSAAEQRRQISVN